MHKTPLTDLALAAATVCYSAVWNVRKLQRKTRGVFNSSPNNSQSHVDRNKCGLLKMRCSPQVCSLRERSMSLFGTRGEDCTSYLSPAARLIIFVSETLANTQGLGDTYAGPMSFTAFLREG